MIPIALVTSVVTTPACKKLSERRAHASASTSSSAALAASAAAKEAAAAREAASAAAREAASAAAAAKAHADTAALEKVRQAVDDLKWMVAHHVTQNPASAGEGDASTRCSTIESSAKTLAPDASVELKKAVDEGVALCAFDVPITTAIEALDHLRVSPSQASRRLMCDVATKEIDKARVVRPKDVRVRTADARRRDSCH